MDESKYIDILSSNLNLKNYKTTPELKDLYEEMITFIKNHGEPLPSTSPFIQNKVFSLAKKHDVTVILDGQGADELFAGYHYFFGFYFKGLIKKGRFGQVLNEIYGTIVNNHYNLPLKSLIFVLLPNFLRKEYFKRNSYIKDTFYNSTNSTNYFRDFYSCNNLHEALIFHLEHKLEHLLSWEDKNSMSHSRESRVPFLDKRLMHFVLKLPEEYIINRGTTKRILRDSLKGIIPIEILDRKDKIGFAPPEENWIKDKLFNQIFQDNFIENKPLTVDFLNMEKVIDDFNKLKDKNQKHNISLFKVLFLELWYKTYFLNN